jgi:hypothetical protein
MGTAGSGKRSMWGLLAGFAHICGDFQMLHPMPLWHVLQ